MSKGCIPRLATTWRAHDQIALWDKLTYLTGIRCNPTKIEADNRKHMNYYSFHFLFFFFEVASGAPRSLNSATVSLQLKNLGIICRFIDVKFYLLHDVFYFVLFTVQDHPPLFFVLQILEQWAVGLILPLVFQVPHIYGCHLPLPLCCCVQNHLQRCQAWGWQQSWIEIIVITSVNNSHNFSLQMHDILISCWQMGQKWYCLRKKVIKQILCTAFLHNVCVALLQITQEVVFKSHILVVNDCIATKREIVAIEQKEQLHKC